MQGLLNIHDNVGLLGAELTLKSFPEVLREVQEYISKIYASLLSENPDDKQELIKSYIVLALCIHWFYPVVWVSFMISHKDMEISCDERVLSILGTNIRNSYVSSLLNLAVKQNHLLTGGVQAFGESSIKSRIKKIMSYKKPAFWTGSVCSNRACVHNGQ